MNLNFVRPSTLARVIEDAAIGTVRGIGRGGLFGIRYVRGATRSIAHDVGLEVQARTLAKYQRRLRKQSEALDSMTPKQLSQLNRDMLAVQQRAAQLSAK